MIDVLAVCDRAKPSLSSRGFDQTISINQYSPKRNLRLEILNVSHWMLRTLKPLTRDLLDIAAFVYAADTSVPRGTEADVFSEDWVRKFTFAIPVREIEIWDRDSIRTGLSELLEYLTEDKFEFIFSRRSETADQLIFDSFAKELPPCPEADCVSLFSGGMDSLAGAVYLQAEGRKPVLVSHQSRSVLKNLQSRLLSPLRGQLTSWSFPHLGVWINRIGSRATENSQRSRSFLYSSLGALVAHELGINTLMICENGITSSNLPRIGQTTGALATRSTHPHFLQLFARLISTLFEAEFKVETPFIWKTRAEVINVLKEKNCEYLLPLSCSCAQSRRPKIHPHCGTCSQCVDRKFAVIYAGLDSSDELLGYEKNIFLDSLEEGTQRMQVMSPVQFALDLRNRNLDSFCVKYPQVYDTIVDSSPREGEKILQATFDLHRRYAEEVYEVVSEEYAKNWEKLFNRELPESCLLMLTSPASNRRSDTVIEERSRQLVEDLRNCAVGTVEALEDICEEIMTFLFCEDISPRAALRKPQKQSKTDHGYRRRDLVLENRASEGFWAEARQEYGAAGIVVDAKNYSREIDGTVVNDFSKYLKESGIGRLGIILARHVPNETRSAVTNNDRIPSGVEEQKNQWRDFHKMIVLLGEDDVTEMLNMKAKKEDPTDLLRERVFALKTRI